MKQNLFSPLIALILWGSASAFAAPAASDQFLFGHSDNAHIAVNNRVLARVNGKPISVIDIMKKMDMIFLRQFPEYTSIPQARFQFYEINWKHVLEDLIDKELILADAEENKVQVSSGDVRQEMETLFGPNIIDNLDKIGLGFDEAYKIVQGDIKIRRMMYMRVNGKALRQLTPQAIRAAYEEFSKNNIRKDAWNYRVISIRNPESPKGQETSELAYKMLTQGLPLEELQKKLKEEKRKDSVSITDSLFHTDADVAEIIKPILLEMTPGTYSKPIAQKSRADKSTVYRILYLKEKIPGGAVPFSEIEMQLKNELMDAAIAQETDAYLKKLRSHFDVKESHINELIPENFQPFSFK